MTAKREPASIRYKNPGAMWGNNAIATKWGASDTVVLNDGKGQGNNIAVFPDYVSGICAQLDLWRTSKNYRGKKFKDAIAIWSGHNSVESYIAYVLKRVPGMNRDTVMNDTFWSGPMGIGFLKAQAAHEAGRVYPAPAGAWAEAQRRVFELSPPKTGLNLPALPKATTVIRTVGGAAGTLAAAGAGDAVVNGPVTDKVEKVRQTVDTAGQVIGQTKEIVQVVPDGFWHKFSVFVQSPGFLLTALVIVCGAWLVTYLLRNREP